jgi:hypothetical protein
MAGDVNDRRRPDAVAMRIEIGEQLAIGISVT